MAKKFDAMAVVAKSHGEYCPVWVMELAEACTKNGLRKTAQYLGVSPALVSLVINNREHGGRDLIHSRVVEKLMEGASFSPLLENNDVQCPVLGAVNYMECKGWQGRPLITSDPMAVSVYRACHGGCKHYEAKNEKNV